VHVKVGDVSHPVDVTGESKLRHHPVYLSLGITRSTRKHEVKILYFWEDTSHCTQNARMVLVLPQHCGVEEKFRRQLIASIEIDGNLFHRIWRDREWQDFCFRSRRAIGFHQLALTHFAYHADCHRDGRHELEVAVAIPPPNPRGTFGKRC